MQFASVTLQDSEGNEVLCKCGKPACQAIIGKEAYLAQCSKCAGYDIEPVEFSFKPFFSESELENLKSKCMEWMFKDDITSKR